MWGCGITSDGGWMGGVLPGGILSALLYLLALAAIAFFVLRLLGWVNGRRTSCDRDRRDSLTILRVRYAKGEISRTDYARMRQLLVEP